MRTGGRLNSINEKYHCNDPAKTIRVSSLLRHHAPRTENDMLRLLETHEKQRCLVCGEQARNGGLPGWVQMLCAAAARERAAVTEDDCRAFIFDLYVRAPVQGFFYEDRALAWLRNLGYKNVRLATPAEDCDFAVDLVLTQADRQAGIQVKPLSYKFVRPEVHALNLTKNAKAPFPVFYLYYQNDGSWEEQGATVLNALWLHFQPLQKF